MSDTDLDTLKEVDEEEDVSRGRRESTDASRTRVSFSALTNAMAPSSSATFERQRSHRHSSTASDPTPIRNTTGRRISFTSFLPFTRVRRNHSDETDSRYLSPRFRRSTPTSQSLNQSSPSMRSPNLPFVGRSTALRFASSSNSDDMMAAVQEHDKARAKFRRYRVGDSVLVSNHQSRWANVVNRFGYPPGGGYNSEEQRGPYIYVLATVKQVHFGENAEYYTVTRADTGGDQRADTEWMEPLQTARGEAAALRAAKESAAPSSSEPDSARSSTAGGPNDSGPNSKVCAVLETVLCILLAPVFCIYDCFYDSIGTRLQLMGSALLQAAKFQGHLFLNGMKPYAISLRVTAVNVLVTCSTWYMFIDQARLGFFPPSADYTLAIISFIVWIVLLLELVLEVFIRPEGYRSLITSDKAYAPSTVRFINAFHLVVETISLAVFVPEFLCVLTPNYQCGDRPTFSFFNATFMAVLGPSRIDAFYGRAYYALVRFRVFGLVRHWKKMWINNTFVTMRWKPQNGPLLFQQLRIAPTSRSRKDSHRGSIDEKKEKDIALVNASNIGTALIMTNSHRALMIVCAIAGVFPLLGTFQDNGGTNPVAPEMVQQLQAVNLMLNNRSDLGECEFFAETVLAWVVGVSAGSKTKYLHNYEDLFLLYLSIEPVRCPQFALSQGGVVTSAVCDIFRGVNNGTLYTTADQEVVDRICTIWGDVEHNVTEAELATRADIRTGAIGVNMASSEATLILSDGTQTITNYTVVAKFNHTFSVKPAAISSFLLQLCLVICILGGLSVLRRDAGILVLGPLRRMLKIVARYAKNPLAPATARKGDERSDEDSDADGDGVASPEDQLGNYETEQLINAITKIADLLRKCWGVAGADIISTNLATQQGTLTEVFNPTVPGKSVYALFGFAAINGFDHMLRNLGDDVMILINDVAAVLHGEVFRWGFGDSGQCNKNLGSAFLMVYRIGLVKEVIQKLEQATDVVFSNPAKKSNLRRRGSHAGVTHRTHTDNAGNQSGSRLRAARAAAAKRKALRTTSTKAMSLSLQSLPGISAFTDRAVIGMLKSFAGISRDNKLLEWKNDFRIGAGVGAFSVNMIFGMDAGWAVEGAVGSEYKIDATYLSPHVNMASRMMSACKQYGVSILLSQAVQELMSETARSKLRHLDTVTVKGSSLQQMIFTYDARHKGVNFFLFSRSDEQADMESDRYSPNIWNTDQDLTAMRQHVTEDFEDEFNKGRDAYLAGNWSKAMRHLEAANEIMVQNVMDQGYIQDEVTELQNRAFDGEEDEAGEELRQETGDGPSRCLLSFMEKEGGHAPATWTGFRPLQNK